MITTTQRIFCNPSAKSSHGEPLCKTWTL